MVDMVLIWFIGYICVTYTWRSIITWPPSFWRHNWVNIQFIYAKISRPEREIMLCEVLSEFSQPVPPLPSSTVTSLWRSMYWYGSQTVVHPSACMCQSERQVLSFCCGLLTGQLLGLMNFNLHRHLLLICIALSFVSIIELLLVLVILKVWC